MFCDTWNRPLVAALIKIFRTRRWPPSAADGKFELLKDLPQRFEPWQAWLPVGGDQVAQQPNQRAAIVLGQVEGAFCRQRVTTAYQGHLRRDFDISDDDIVA